MLTTIQLQEPLSGNEIICIEVVNLSLFEVTISQVGIGTKSKKKDPSLVDYKASTIDGEHLPLRLRSRESATLYMNAPIVDFRKLLIISHGYAVTDCGITVYGTSPALKDAFAQVNAHA